LAMTGAAPWPLLLVAALLLVLGAASRKAAQGVTARA
jgi:predicted membrane protein